MSEAAEDRTTRVVGSYVLAAVSAGIACGVTGAAFGQALTAYIVGGLAIAMCLVALGVLLRRRVGRTVE